MNDCMTFPDTVEEFMKQYKIVDTDGIYMSKGAELVPIFRMRQWFEHLPCAQPEIEERMSETEQNVPNDDFISRKGAIDAIEAVFPVDPMKSEYAQGIACGAALSKTYIEQLPSAQPERKKGKWGNRGECPFCSYLRQWEDDRFCGNCGADMRGEQE